jgi:hypothetical protein
MTINLLSTNSILFGLNTAFGGVDQIWNYLGEVATVTGNFLTLFNPAAVSGWDANVNSYAATTDAAHLFKIDGQTFVSDSYSAYYESIGVSFVRERNSFNTFFAGNPSDDILPLIEDALNLAFTVLVGTPEQPANRVDDLGFYITRNGYISRNEAQNVLGNAYNGYYTRHQDYSEPIRTNLFKISQDINWNEWNKGNVLYANWDSWALAVDYLQPSQSALTYAASGTARLSGTGQPYGKFAEFSYFPTGNFITYMSNVITFLSSDNSVNTTGPSFTAARFSPGQLVQITGSISNNVLGVIVSVSATKMILTQCAITNESNTNNITINVTALSFTGDGKPYGPARSFTYLPSGTAVFSGAAITSAYDIYYAPEPTGEGHLTGAAITSFTWTWRYVATGRMILSGAATGTQISVSYTGSGTAHLSGAAITQANLNYIASGTAILSGAALTSFNAVFEYTPTGTAVLSGAALTQQYSIVADVQGGTMITSGVITYVTPGIYITYTLTADITFASSDNSINTISGNFLAAGFLAGQLISVTGSVFNNIVDGFVTFVDTNKIIISDTILLVDESDLNTITITYASLTFLASDNSINLSVPATSFLTLGFAVNQFVTVTGSTFNNVTGRIFSLTDTKMILIDCIITDEADTDVVTITADRVITTYEWHWAYVASGTAQVSGTVIGFTQVDITGTIQGGTAILQGAAASEAFSLGFDWFTGSGTAVLNGSAIVQPVLSDYVYRIAGGTAVLSGAALTSSP